ncbi:Murein tetrapeptide carboxypeptidase [Sodalis glossinidius str. 'morsitans']|uniref:Murein tetrapeptide carboxypeptidase n=1 Tax=Sodalis glossinidius (strain morsitans) TaxID=343509 RepID=Q2NSS8_SODGM|nr:LD-carboxypeptidase [Sodalis glossinidius]BAE74797.1 hypothetical protein SG1522 [Sodalis glossinidius str. 'morsitans']CRL45605.1 Murein tetrapeptide carboxypeptidase [Sodalis glossinidius str. 'morsitans']
MKYPLIAFLLSLAGLSSSTVGAAAPNTLYLIANNQATLESETTAKPKIYLISSSSQYDENTIGEIKAVFQQQGYSVDSRYLDQQPTPLGYVNTDEVRAETLINALTDENVKYLWFVRGGSGALNLYPYLYRNRDKIAAASPKILIGFSDVTALHHFINNVIKWPSIHGILASFNSEMYEVDKTEQISMYSGIQQVFRTITNGMTYTGIEPLNVSARAGGQGTLNGGNLTLVQSLFSTRYEKNYADKVMLMEDTGVTYKQLDRTLHQLEYKKNFHPKAVIFGQFYSINANKIEKDLYRYVLQEFANRVDYPVYYYPEFGHGKTNQPFILGQQMQILCNEHYRYCSLTQPPVKR